MKQTTRKSKVKQVENSKSGIYHVENKEVQSTDDSSPSGYFIEKSRKTELYRIKQKEDVKIAEEIKKQNTLFERIKTWLKNLFKD